MKSECYEQNLQQDLKSESALLKCIMSTGDLMHPLKITMFTANEACPMLRKITYDNQGLIFFGHLPIPCLNFIMKLFVGNMDKAQGPSSSGLICYCLPSFFATDIQLIPVRKIVTFTTESCFQASYFYYKCLMGGGHRI